MTGDLNAYMLHLKGRHSWNARTEEGAKKAIELLQAAIALDPDYALAYSGIADSYSLLANRSKAMEAAEKALTLDPGLVEAHASLGLIREEFSRDLVGAEERLQRAIALNPSYAMARHWYAILLTLQGRNEEALAQLRKAVELDPFSPVSAALVTELLRES